MKGISITVVRNGEEIDLTISGTPHKACRGSRDGRYGPPLEPDEPAWFEVDIAVDRDGREVVLTDEELRQAEEAAMEHLARLEEAAMDARCDRGMDD